MPQSTVQWRQEASETDLRSRASEMVKEWAELSSLDRSDPSYDTAKAGFLAEIEEIDMNLTLRQMAAQRQAQSAQLPPEVLAALGAGGSEHRSAGDLVLADAKFEEWRSQQSGRGAISGQSPTVELRTLITSSASATGGAGSLLPTSQPYLANVNRQRLFVRNLISVQSTTFSAVNYVREKNAVTNQTSASTVAEAGNKPEAVMEWTPDIAPVQVIATWIPVTNQALDDISTLRGYIDGRLTYMLQLREEAEILNGNGITPDLKGILKYSDIQTQAATAGERAITIANAMCLIELRNGQCDGVVMNPSDAWAMFTKRSAGGAGQFDAGDPFSSLPLNVWGVPVVRSLSTAAGTAVVGAWSLGATLFDRQQAGVRVFDQYSDYPTKNQTLLLAEERIALAVTRADWFVSTTLSS